MSNLQNAPRKPHLPAGDTSNYVTGSRKEQVVFYVTIAATLAVLLVVLYFAFAG